MIGRPSKSLAAGRRRIDSALRDVKVGSWIYDNVLEKWCLPFAVVLDASIQIPPETRWVVTAEEKYPQGAVEVYPAIDGGITDTFPHQSNNGLAPVGSYCKSGKLCLLADGELSLVPEDADFKIEFFVERALAWIRQANEGTLMGPGSRLELPAYRCCGVHSLIYKEDEITKRAWDSCDEVSGLADIVNVGGRLRAVLRFNAGDAGPAIFPRWGDRVLAGSFEGAAIWIRVPGIPSVKLWQAPNDYSELRSFLSGCGVDFDETIGKYSKMLRDGERHYLLIGFPAPDIVGEVATHLTWVACLLPALSGRGDLGKAAKGKESTLRAIDKHKVFCGSTDIEWTSIVNVAKEQLHSRGSLCDELVSSDVLVVGAGSLGSMICEGLARGGVTRFSISDDDLFVAGNVTRHTLGFCSSMKSKASELCERLRDISPNVEASAFDALGLSGGPSLGDYDLIVMCTGFSAALNCLEGAKVKADAGLAIFSFGMGAKNVFCWMGQASHFDKSDYEKAILSYSEEEQHGGLEMPWEGTGCWSPVFPASYSDVAAAASICLRALNAYMTKGSEQPQMWMFQQQYDEGGFPVGMKGMRL